MPYAIWCSTCPKPTIIGQGVRFNAEKKKVGNYLSTPIFCFRMKHVACGGWIEIRTDPKNTAYVVTEGAKKRDAGEDRIQEGEIRIKTDEEREKLQNDAFAAFEVTIDDKRQATIDKSRIAELFHAKDKDWEDPYAASRKLRKTFRAERKIREKNEAMTENLKDRLSLGIDLLDEIEEDRRRAGFVEFGVLGGESHVKEVLMKAEAKGLFAPIQDTKGTSGRVGKRSKQTKARESSEQTKEKLRQELNNNTRAALDPFLGNKSGLTSMAALPGVKRKRSPGRVNVVGRDNEETKTPLVQYDSD